MIDLTTVLITPVISEKSMKDADMNKYTFKVLKSADKNLIKKAVEKKFSVEVVKISTLISKGKKKREGKRREEINIPSFKKAVVSLKAGQKIGLFSVSKK